jgi:hypothetical protein
VSGGFTAVRVVGGVLPPEVLAATVAGDLQGLGSADYHLGGEAPREAAARAWSHLTGSYRRFRDDLAKLPDGDHAVGLTRERWLSQLLIDLGYGRVAPTPTGGLAVGDRSYPVSHRWGATPMHLLGWGVELDSRTPGVTGAAQRAPHAMVQEVLNRTDDYLWAVVSNGRLLRLLRDSSTLSGQAYVEFDLEAMFDGELFAEFVVLFLLAHESRVEVPAEGRPADCWLERWRTTAVSQGVRALSLLRDGVQAALEVLGTGFLQHPANASLRAILDRAGGETAGEVKVRLEDFHEMLLRTVYRLLFWSVAEDRDALLDPAAGSDVRDRYAQHFSSERLRRLAVRRHGSAHDDLWRSVTLVFDALGEIGGEPRLGLPGLGGLFTESDVHKREFAGLRLGNQPLLAAVRALSIVQPKGQPRRQVDFRHLGAEELGSIYESLLELVPRRNTETQEFTLELLAGNERKTSGSYYTPTDLVELVLDTALDPVLDDAEKSNPDERAAALLAVTVCDPAIGSGHFMVAAARRIAQRLAAARTGEVDPTPTAFADAMHDVVARCVYGVDVNPLAADLAKFSLWLEAMTPGRPLSFLDHHIKVGNALLGTTPALLHAGIPDAAYVALTGDDKKVATAWKKTNQTLRAGQTELFTDDGIPVGNTAQRALVATVAARAEAALTLADVAWSAQRYRDGQDSPELANARAAADGWSAAFLCRKRDGDTEITTADVERLATGTASPQVAAVAQRIRSKHRLFHWCLEFPEIFRVPDDGPANNVSGWTGGFSAMLGNPPWERVKLQEQEFFASRDPAVANAVNAAARKKAIDALKESDPHLHSEFEDARRSSEAASQFLRTSGRYPLCGVGDVNTYSIFAEHFRSSVAPDGRMGIIAPTGLVTDFSTAAFFANATETRTCAAVLDFVTGPEIWGAIGHGRFRFSVIVCTGGEPVDRMALAFNVEHPRDLQQADRVMTLSPGELRLVNPNTGTCPIFENAADARITLAAYRLHPVLVRDGGMSPWSLRFGTLFHMANDSGSFIAAETLAADGAAFDGWAWTSNDERWLPLYEAKMLNRWNQRFSGYANMRDGYEGTALPRLSAEDLDDPAAEPLARYWVAEKEVVAATPDRWDREWFLGWRDIARASDVRTFVPSVLPKAAVGDKFLLAMPADPTAAPLLQAIWSSFVFDYISRQKISGTGMKYFLVKQLACPEPAVFEVTPGWSDELLDAFVRARVLELTYTSYRIRPYAVDVVGGEPGGPFRWLPERRDQLRAELDAAMLHLYGLDRSDSEHVLDSFLVLRKYEDRDHGEFRTKRLVLAAYDAMAGAAETGVPFVSPLDPPPGHGPRHASRTP